MMYFFIYKHENYVNEVTVPEDTSVLTQMAEAAI